MKKRYFKDGSEIVLIMIQMLLILLLGSEVDDLGMFFISKILFLTLFIINHKLLCKYGYIIKTLNS